MKNVKKAPTKQLEKFSNIFTQLGLVLVLFIVYFTLEYKTIQKSVAFFEPDIVKKTYVDPSTEVFFQNEHKVLQQLKTPKSNPFILDAALKKVENTDIETTINRQEPEPVKFDITTLVVVKEPEKIDDNEGNVPYLIIEDAPIFKGCEGLSKTENKKCFDKQMMKFVQRNFDVSLANDLGLSSGKYKILTQFIIDKNGDVVDIQIRAPHKRLQIETQDLIEKLPKFTPGKQRDKPVKVKYTLPISFQVD